MKRSQNHELETYVTQPQSFRHVLAVVDGTLTQLTFLPTPMHSLASHTQLTKSMKGSLSHELETGLPAADVWEVYGSLLLGQLIPQLLPNILSKVEVVEGDGGVGTVLHLTFPPGFRGLAFQREKFIKIDNENFIKEALVVEGGFLDLGFLKYLVRLEIIENAYKTSIIRSTIEYEVGDEDINTASLATTSTLACIAEAITKYIKVQKSAEQTLKQTS